MSDIQKTGYVEQDLKKQLALQKKQLIKSSSRSFWSFKNNYDKRK